MVRFTGWALHRNKTVFKRNSDLNSLHLAAGCLIRTARLSNFVTSGDFSHLMDFYFVHPTSCSFQLELLLTPSPTPRGKKNILLSFPLVLCCLKHKYLSLTLTRWLLSTLFLKYFQKNESHWSTQHIPLAWGRDILSVRSALWWWAGPRGDVWQTWPGQPLSLLSKNKHPSRDIFVSSCSLSAARMRAVTPHWRLETSPTPEMAH